MKKKNELESLHLRAYEISFRDLCDDLIGHIGEYLIDPVASFGMVNRVLFELFHIKFPLKYYLKKRFNIPELFDVNKNNVELHGILNLSCCRKDPFVIFGCLIEDIVSGKGPYKTLIGPLSFYLSRTFQELTMSQQSEFDNHLIIRFGCSFKSLLGKICGERGLYDLAFDYLKNNPENLIRYFLKFENRDTVYEFFKSNPILAIQYQITFLSAEIAQKLKFPWIAECLIFDAPEGFYTDLLRFDPLLLKHLTDDLFLSLKVPEFEYPRIHAQVRRLFDEYLRPLNGEDLDLDFHNLINDLRFGSIDLQQQLQLNNFSNFNTKNLTIIAKAALFGYKKDIFLSICTTNNSILNRIVMDVESDDGHESQMYLKVIFDIIASDPKISQDYYLRFIMKFYAINHFEIEGNLIRFEFVALENLLTLGFPPKIRASAALIFMPIC